MIDEQMPHRLGADREEMRPPPPINFVMTNQLQEYLVNDGCGIECVSGRITAQM